MSKKLTQLSQNAKARYLWDAALQLWGEDVGEVSWAIFDEFLNVVGELRSWGTRNTYRQIMRSKGYIHYKDKKGEKGNPRKVSIHAVPHEVESIKVRVLGDDGSVPS